MCDFRTVYVKIMNYLISFFIVNVFFAFLFKIGWEDGWKDALLPPYCWWFFRAIVKSPNGPFHGPPFILQSWKYNNKNKQETLLNYKSCTLLKLHSWLTASILNFWKGLQFAIVNISSIIH